VQAAAGHQLEWADDGHRSSTFSWVHAREAELLRPGQVATQSARVEGAVRTYCGMAIAQRCVRRYRFNGGPAASQAECRQAWLVAA
jgi:hypothetical protein